MPKFKYQAVALTGETVAGEYASPDEAGVIAMLRQGHYYPTRITLSGTEKLATKKKIKVKPLAGFCSQMSAMLKAGVPIAKTLEILKDQTEDKPLRLVLEDVYAAVHRGNSLSEALAPYNDHFPAIFLNMVEAGEATGMLDSCLERAGISFSRTAKLNNKVRNAMIYPSIVLFVMIGLLIIMLTVVVPAFSTLYEDSGADLPGFTQLLLTISDFLQTRWYIVLGVAAGIMIGARAWIRSARGRLAFDRFKLNAPAVKKLLNKVYAARFARTLSSLTSAGVPLTQSLTVTARSIVNKHVENEIYKIVDAVNRGEEMSAPLERMGLLPPMIVFMTKLGEESGTMDELLTQAADYYDEESDSALQALMSMMEPALIILMAVVVVPILIAVLMPMFNMYSLMM
jgi:type IV pilus assembly protein PilC